MRARAHRSIRGLRRSIELARNTDAARNRRFHAGSTASKRPNAHERPHAQCVLQRHRPPDRIPCTGSRSSCRRRRRGDRGTTAVHRLRAASCTQATPEIERVLAITDPDPFRATVSMVHCRISPRSKRGSRANQVPPCDPPQPARCGDRLASGLGAEDVFSKDRWQEWGGPGH